MSKIALFVLSSGLWACGVEDAQTQARTQAEATTIQIAFDLRPSVVVYRDGVDAPWQYASRTSAVNYQAVVHGPYTVAYGCSDQFAHTVTQLSQMPSDSAQLFGFCAVQTFSGDDFRQVTGRMAQPGTVMFGSNRLETSVPNETFSTIELDGTYELLSVTADHIAMRDGVVVDGDTVIAPVIDTAAQGGPLLHASFAASNAEPNETVTATSFVITDNSVFLLHSGALDGVPFASDGVLSAGAEQSVSVRARNGVATRAQRIVASEASSKTAVLPAAIGDPTWTESSAALAFDWTSAPAGRLYVSIYGNSTNGNDSTYLSAEASDAYRAATGITHIDVKPSIPGFKPAWNVDLSIPYGHDATFQQSGNGVTNSSWVSEYVEPASAARIAPVQPRAVKARYAQR